MIIAIANSKGGVGKSTTCIQVGAERARRGRDVLVINGDRQHSAELAMLARAEANVLPAIACVRYTEGPELRAQLKHQRSKYDDVIIDVGGRDSSAMRAALAMADVVIVPFAPGSFDVWALEDMNTLLQEALSTRDPFPIYALLNLADPKKDSSDNLDALSALDEYPIYTRLPFVFVRRKAFANASGQGISVNELKPKVTKASEELDMLMAILDQ